MAAGPNGNLFPGKLYEVDEVFGSALVEGRYAEEVDSRGNPLVREAAAPMAVEEIVIPEEPVGVEEDPDPVFNSIEKGPEEDAVNKPRAARTKRG